jgi:hypothetical protein
VELLMSARATSYARLTRIERFYAFALHENGEAQNREVGLTDCFCRANNARGEVAMERARACDRHQPVWVVNLTEHQGISA